MFAPFDNLRARLHRGARCYCLFVGERAAAFARRPHDKVKDVMGVSRLVTLPDWQGLGLAFVLVDPRCRLRAIGERLHTYPVHPALVRAITCWIGGDDAGDTETSRTERWAARR